jgi:hypothetical protein
MKQTPLLLTTTLAVFLGVSCGLFPPLAGNGSEITNGCCMVAQTGKPADSAMVIAYPKEYVPAPVTFNEVMPETTFTDTAGRFTLALGHGEWNLLIYDRTGTLGAFVPVHRDSSLYTIALDDLGYVQGMNYDTCKRFINYVGIAGSPFYAAINPLCSFVITGIPSSTYQVQVWQGPPCVKISDSVYLCQVYEPTKSVPRGGPPQAGHTIPGITIGTVTLDPGQGANISIGP